MPLDDAKTRALLDATAATHDEELDCEEFLQHMGRLAELRAGGGVLPPSLRLAAEHVALCANCREELEAIVEVLGAGPGPAG